MCGENYIQLTNVVLFFYPRRMYSRICHYFMFKTDRHRIPNCDIWVRDVSDHAGVYLTFYLDHKPKETVEIEYSPFCVIAACATFSVVSLTSINVQSSLSTKPCFKMVVLRHFTQQSVWVLHIYCLCLNLKNVLSPC